MIRFKFTFFYMLLKYFLVSLSWTTVKIGLDYISEVLWSIHFMFIFHIHAVRL